MRHQMFTLLTAAAILLVSAGCSKAGESVNQNVTVFNNKIEIDQQLKDFAVIYERKTGIHVEIESCGGNENYQDVLKNRSLSGKMPDIFAFDGSGTYLLWKDRIANLDNEKWIKKTNYDYENDGHTYGFPFAVEGYGLAYNADMLTKAEIDPDSLTTIDAYKEAFKKLDEMKEDLGIDSVVAMVSNVAEGTSWVTGAHSFGVYLSAGVPSPDTHVIDAALSGKVDTARLQEYAGYVKLLFDYSEQNILQAGNYQQQVKAFTDQKSVFIHQGNWIDPLIEKANVSFHMGFAPHAFSKNKIDGIQIGAPSWWAVNKEGNVAGAKKFLENFALSEEGRDARVNKMHLISPYSIDTVKPTSPLSVAVYGYISLNKTYPWEQYKLPDGFSQNILGPIYQELAQKKITENEFVQKITDAVATIPAKK